MIRSAYEILSWYLSPRRLPWFAIAEFGIALASVIAYEATSASLWIVAASAATFFGTYFAAHHYTDLGRWPQTQRERARQEERVAAWYANLSDRDRDKVRALSENLRRLNTGGISFADAAAALRRFI